MAPRQPLDHERLRQVMDKIAAEAGEADDWGASYRNLPELASVEPNRFGLAVLTRDGRMTVVGDSETQFSIQSISKVFALGLALEAFGEAVWSRTGREPSGDPFNSIIDLERHEGTPRNPLINAGALVVVDMLLDRDGTDDKPDRVDAFLARMMPGETIGIDEKVAGSEEGSSYTNRALANLAKSFGNFTHEVDDVIHAYVRQCAVALSCRQLALAGRFLMEDGGADPSSEEARRIRGIKSLMMTCGMYDGAGDFAFRVGLPAKSGIGGGILAIAPGVASIAVWSPGLDGNGNSLQGAIALEKLSKRMSWSVFGAGMPPG